jgi:r-opsin
MNINISSLAKHSGMQQTVMWGYPPGVTIVDLVPEDMLDMVHPHWKQFPPVNPMWHYLLGTLYIFLGATSITGKILFLMIHLIRFNGILIVT